MKRVIALGLGTLFLVQGTKAVRAQEIVVAGDKVEVVAPAPATCAPTWTGNVCCADEADDSCQDGGFYATVGFLFVKPKVDNNTAFRVRAPFGEGEFRTLETKNFDLDSAFAPQVTVGFVGESGFGARVHYFHLESTANASGAPNNSGAEITSVSPFNATDTVEAEEVDPGLFVRNKITMDVEGIEATKTFNSSLWSVVIGGGIGIAHIQQDYQASHVAHNADAGFDFLGGTVNSGNTFDGVGPQLALDVHRLLGDSGLALFASSRTAVLFGTSHESVVQIEFDADHPANIDTVDRFSKNNDHTVPMVEFQAGAEYSRQMGDLLPFAQLGFVYQEWFDIGSATKTGGGLSLIGLTASAGVHF